MSSTTTQVAVSIWRYQCPECGIGDRDTGHLHPDDAIYCEACLEDGQHVKLRRWPAESGALPGSGAGRD